MTTRPGSDDPVTTDGARRDGAEPVRRVRGRPSAPRTTSNDLSQRAFLTSVTLAGLTTDPPMRTTATRTTTRTRTRRRLPQGARHRGGLDAISELAVRLTYSDDFTAVEQRRPLRARGHRRGPSRCADPPRRLGGDFTLKSSRHPREEGRHDRGRRHRSDGPSPWSATSRVRRMTKGDPGLRAPGGLRDVRVGDLAALFLSYLTIDEDAVAASSCCSRRRQQGRGRLSLSANGCPRPRARRGAG